MFDCKACLNKSLCVSCIQLEKHLCPNLDEAKDKKIALLEKQLQFKPPPKLAKI